MKKEDIKDCFNEVNYIEEILETVSYFHYRNGVQHDEGSMGTIEITPKEFKDVLAYWFMEGLNDH